MDVALQAFSARGYSAVRLSDIAADAGVTRGAVYWHFSSKKGLLLAILREVASSYIQVAMEVLGSDLEPTRKISEMIHRLISATEKSDVLLAHRRLAMRFMAETPGGLEDVHKAISNEMRSVTRMLTRVIREGQSAGEIRSDVDAKIISGAIVAILRGSAIPKGRQYPGSIPRGASNSVADLVIKGLEPR